MHLPKITIKAEGLFLIIIPIIVLIFLSMGKYVLLQGDFSVSGKFRGDSACNEERYTEVIKIQTIEGILPQASYFLQSKIELPLAKLCITNLGPKYRDLFNGTLYSQITLFQKNITMDDGEKYCENIEPGTIEIPLIKKSTYCYYFNSTIRPQNDLSNSIGWKEEVEINYRNLLFQTIIWSTAFFAIYLIWREILRLVKDSITLR